MRQDSDGGYSSYSSEDSSGEMLTPSLAVDIQRTIALIRAKDPAIYEKDKTFFGEETMRKRKHRGKEDKKVTLKDLERKHIEEKMEKGDEYVSDSSSSASSSFS